MRFKFNPKAQEKIVICALKHFSSQTKSIVTKIIVTIRLYRLLLCDNDIKITPSAREDVDLLAVAEELIREDFYADDYVDSTMKLISDNIFYETVKLNYIELIRNILR